MTYIAYGVLYMLGIFSFVGGLVGILWIASNRLQRYARSKEEKSVIKSHGKLKNN